MFRMEVTGGRRVRGGGREVGGDWSDGKKRGVKIEEVGYVIRSRVVSI
jgi:hypothetical protein